MHECQVGVLVSMILVILEVIVLSSLNTNCWLVCFLRAQANIEERQGTKKNCFYEKQSSIKFEMSKIFFSII